jgi:bifunctional N-acetylglucosamine-1-phosphate-uridyltransferase/glucosamine-1-phosphate-acetyltransferase GlmU-like protein
VTHAVPAGKLTVARARQVTVDEWRRPQKSPQKNSDKEKIK